MNKISEIRFKVSQDVALIDPERQTHIAVKGHKEHVWRLGLGPCGREVESLHYDIGLYALTIKQVSYPEGHKDTCERAMKYITELPVKSPERDAAVKAYYETLDQRKVELFIYPLEQIVGRIRAQE